MKKKGGGPCSKGGALYGFPGPKCSLCCVIFSFFGIIVLIVTGALLEEPYRKVEGESIVVDHEAHESAKTAYYTAIIYAVFVLGCLARVIWLRQRPPVQNEYEDEDY